MSGEGNCAETWKAPVLGLARCSSHIPALGTGGF